MEYTTWTSRWKAIAKYYRRRLQVEQGIRCELCTKKLICGAEFGICNECHKTLAESVYEHSSRISDPDTGDV